jgi:hypothetical protein
VCHPGKQADDSVAGYHLVFALAGSAAAAGMLLPLIGCGDRDSSRPATSVAPASPGRCR